MIATSKKPTVSPIVVTDHKTKLDAQGIETGLQIKIIQRRSQKFSKFT